MKKGVPEAMFHGMTLPNTETTRPNQFLNVRAVMGLRLTQLRRTREAYDIPAFPGCRVHVASARMLGRVLGPRGRY